VSAESAVDLQVDGSSVRNQLGYLGLVRFFPIGCSAVAVLLAATLVGCGSDTKVKKSKIDSATNTDVVKSFAGIRIVTTVSPITSLVAAVAGGVAGVTAIDGVIPEGTNSHTFEPSPAIAKELSNADLLYMNGLRLEEPTKKLAEANLKAGAQIIELGANAITEDKYIYDSSFPREGGKPNPHLWTNPNLAKVYATQIKDDLVKRLPDNAAVIDANYQALAAKLDQLSDAMKTATATVPGEQRKLLTYHDSFPYFARDFGWTVIGAIQPSEFDEPTPRDVANLIDQVKKEKVVAIFGSEVFPSPVLEQIGKESGATYVDTLRDDDLPGAPGDADHSYLGLMRSDFVTMINALGGDSSALTALDITLSAPDRANYAQ
jgi:ABC-type Zn uptake system ZnuABC Zn-binding protein ZnuA